MSDDLEEIRQVMREADCLFDQHEVAAAVERLAEDITECLQNANPVVCCVMNGGLIFAGQLLPLLRFPLQQTYLHASRYRDEISGGALEWLVRPQVSLAGRNVLILDDILDEGHTLLAIAEECRRAGASNVQIAVLLDKDHQRKARADFRADFTGLTCADRYVFGCGMDYKGYWRNTKAIYAVRGL